LDTVSVVVSVVYNTNVMSHFESRTVVLFISTTHITTVYRGHWYHLRYM